ncbi:leukocyte surface antigen CD53-like [Cloeon dipterum]|uniref:leukocyte surface antigen CD53-like n=1 Tax=Cloeon dipterum TaxID=197152 RepID=UPI00321FE914
MGAASVIKYLLFFFNLLICTGGLILLGCGVLLHIELAKQDGAQWKYIAIGFITLGAIIFAIAFLGCCGALRESTCMLNTFGTLLLFIFLIQVICAVLLVVYENQFIDGVGKALKISLGQYKEKPDAKEFWDNIQPSLGCCGSAKPSDWQESGLQIPSSCECKESDGNKKCGNVGNQKIYTEGCYNKLLHAVKSSIIIVAAVAFAVALVELIGAIFSFRLASTIRKREHGFY